jgi:hypothetical protein
MSSDSVDVMHPLRLVTSWNGGAPAREAVVQTNLGLLERLPPDLDAGRGARERGAVRRHLVVVVVGVDLDLGLV